MRFTTTLVIAEDNIQGLHFWSDMRDLSKSPVKFVLDQWEPQADLFIQDSSYSDEQLKELLSSCTKLQRLWIKECPNLYTLSALSELPNLTSLDIALSHLQNGYQGHTGHVLLKDLVEEAPQGKPNFDLSKLSLPKLESLTVLRGRELRLLDTRTCPRLGMLTTYQYMNSEEQSSHLVVDIRGLDCLYQKNCGETGKVTLLATNSQGKEVVITAQKRFWYPENLSELR